jgi:hypothetical protein
VSVPAQQRSASTAHPHAFKASAFPVYERLQQGLGDVSLRAILAENPMLRFAVMQEINQGSVAVVSLDIDPATGALADLRLRLSGQSVPDTLGVSWNRDATATSRATPKGR